jgi:two-component system cell cycle response regulator DivK
MVPGSTRETVVLIVEDEPDNREIMRAVVEELLGYRAILVCDGAEALEAATTGQPNVILMDLMLPSLDGFEATRQIKANTLTCHIPVVAVTALGRPIDRQRAMEEGADAYVSKPFDLDALVSVIERYAIDGK